MTLWAGEIDTHTNKHGDKHAEKYPQHPDPLGHCQSHINILECRFSHTHSDKDRQPSHRGMYALPCHEDCLEGAGCWGVGQTPCVVRAWWPEEG